MIDTNGWLLDLYEDGERGLAVWLITEDDRRICLRQSFPVTCYAAGPNTRLRELWRWLQSRSDPPQLVRAERRDLFLPQPIPVLEIRVPYPAALYPLFQEIQAAFPDLTYYDADLQVQVRHAARYGSFPLARCALEVDAQDQIHAWETLDSPWDVDPEPPPLRILEINLPGGDPRRTAPDCLELRCGAWKQTYPFPVGSAPAFWVKNALRKFDPDILITEFGDTWLLAELLKRAQPGAHTLPLNRDPERAIRIIQEKTYFSYGQIVYRGQQAHLFGRLHIDRRNAMSWGDYELEGVLETARVTSLPVQTAARVSPGSGISAMQMITALRNGVLVPWHKQQVEEPHSMLGMIHADYGGLVYQPTVGLHRDVGTLDFVSLYPAVMARCNISPEKTPVTLSDPLPENPGLVPQTLAPLLKKRVSLKQRIHELPAWDPRRKWYKARAAAHKWILVVCFGYLGYKNARFGLISSHEAVTAGGREALLRAKEAAEDSGFEILHMYVDGLWVQRSDCTRPEDFAALQAEITRRTGLPIALDGVYRWIVFLPSRTDSRVPVPSRYFGVFQDGTIKVRGLEARRRDTPAWVSQTQMSLIEYLAKAPDANHLPEYIPGTIQLLRQALRGLHNGQVPLEDLLIGQKLTRVVEKYTHPSPAARAAMQLQAAGISISPGQRVRFLCVHGPSKVWAWDQLDELDPRRIDLLAYQKLLLRAAADVFQPFGIDVQALMLLLEGNAVAVPLPMKRGIKKPWIAPGPSD